MVIETVSGAAYSMDAGRGSARRIENIPADTAGTVVQTNQTSKVAPTGNGGQADNQDNPNQEGKQQQMSEKFVSGAVSNANSHLPTRTKCEFAYDEKTKRVSITIKDEDTDEVIKEIPPKEALEMVAKMWELAGIMVDEKR